MGEGCRWGPGDRQILLGDLPGGSGSFVSAISGDGKVVIGGSGSFTGSQGYRWTEARGMEGIVGDELPDFEFEELTDVSEGGSVIVGWGRDRAKEEVVFVWDTVTGKRLVRDILAQGDVAIPGWSLSRSVAISADGKTIIGWGNNPG